MTRAHHAHGGPCAKCRTDPCPLCAGTGQSPDLAAELAELAAGDPIPEPERWDLPGDAFELPEVDVSDLLDPHAGMPLRERLRARAHALAGDLEHLDGPEADDLAARLRGFLERLDATVPGSTGDPTTRRRAKR